MSSRCITCYLNTVLVLLLIHCRYKFIDVKQTTLQVHCVQGKLFFLALLNMMSKLFPDNVDPNDTHLLYFVMFLLHD
jgi:hypothetical protein